MTTKDEALKALHEASLSIACLGADWTDHFEDWNNDINDRMWVLQDEKGLQKDNAFSEYGCWTRGNDYQSLWTVHKENVQEFLDFLKTKSDAISDNNEPSLEVIHV